MKVELKPHLRNIWSIAIPRGGGGRLHLEAPGLEALGVGGGECVAAVLHSESAHRALSDRQADGFELHYTSLASGNARSVAFRSSWIKPVGTKNPSLVSVPRAMAVKAAWRRASRCSRTLTSSAWRMSTAVAILSWTSHA